MEYKIIKPATVHSAMMNNPELIERFIDMYLSQSPIDFEKLQNSIQARDCSKISEAAHHIKPTMEYIGATEMRLHFEEIETLGRLGDINLIEDRFQEIRIKFSVLLEELAALKKAL